MEKIAKVLRGVVSRPVRSMVFIGLILIAAGGVKLAVWYTTPLPQETDIDDILEDASSSSRFIPMGTYVTVTGTTVDRSVVKYVFPGDRVASYFALQDPMRGETVHVPVLVMENFQHGAPKGTFTCTGQLRPLDDAIAAKYRNKAIAFRRQVYIDAINVPAPYSSIPWLLCGGSIIAAAVKWRRPLTAGGTKTAAILFGQRGTP